MLTLYYSPNSPYARKVRIALAEKGLDFTPEAMAPGSGGPGRTYPEAFENMNPNWRVPLLVDGERKVWESNVILDYLLQTYPDRQGSGNPPFARALTRRERHWEDLMILTTIETVLDSGINLFTLKRAGATPEQIPFMKRETGRIRACLDWLEKQATPEGFAPGEFSVLDLNLVCTLLWLDFRKPAEWRGRQTLEQLVARYADRPSLAATRPTG